VTMDLNCGAKNRTRGWISMVFFGSLVFYVN
jgi:hypothetical protein